MKNFPLAFQIWLVFAAVTLGVFLLLVTFLPWTLRTFFTQQLYELIQNSQNSIILDKAKLLPPEIDFHRPEKEERFRLDHPTAFPPGGPRVRHLLLTEAPDKQAEKFFYPPSVQQIWQEAQKQKTVSERYSRAIGKRTLFYIIHKENVAGKPAYLISYSWSNYRNNLVSTMFWRLVLLVFFLFLLSWLPAAFWLARYLSKPLVQMEKHLEQLSQKNWHEPFILERRDEIGRLAQAFENMRLRLIRQDQAQQSFLQNISHDLKTPVMVIRSFVQSIQDGIFPKGTLEESINVIDSEAQRLEKRIRNLLHLNKINYLNGRELKLETLNLTEIIQRQVERIRWRKPELNWQVELPQLLIDGDREQWEIVLENLLDNQIRYAVKKISITQWDNSSAGTVVRFWNDGPPIEPQILKNIFARYSTGTGGEFGLGLAIVYHILNVHGVKIWAKNEGGAAFYLQIQIIEK